MDFAIHSCPKLFAHRFAVELACWSLGDFRHKFYRLRRLHAAQFCLAMSDDVTFRKLFAVPHNDESFDRLSPLIIGHADDRALLDLG